MLQQKNKSTWLVAALCLSLFPALALAGGSKGLSKSAFEELEAAGVNKYLGEYSPSGYEDMGDGWIRHSFDSAAGHGPVCIDGSDYSVFTRKGKAPRKLLIMLQGGGACWQDFYQCSQSVEGQEPPFDRQGIWDFDHKANPFRKYSVVYMPSCDGSVFSGDSELSDGNFPGPIRYHRGLRNLSAGMDVAKTMFPKPKSVTVAGSSAGGVGVANFAPFLARFQYGNKLKKLTVLNDAGPNVANPAAVDAAAARAADWAFDQFFPASCDDCNAMGQPSIPLIIWRLDNDSRIREAFYSTDGDAVGIFFNSANTPGPPIPFLNQVTYRELFVPEHGKVTAKHPNRYKRFIVSGDASHTAIQSPLFYDQDANGVPLNEWTQDCINNKKRWTDIVEDFVPVP